MTVWLKPIPHDWHAIDESQPGMRISFMCGLRVDYVPDAPTATNPPPSGRCPDCARVATPVRSTEWDTENPFGRSRQ